MQLAGPGVFGPPQGPRRRARRAARGGGERRRPHRHQRLLRPARHQPAHPRGAAPLSATISSSSPRSARGAATDGSWNPAVLGRGADAARCTTTCATSGSTRIDVVNLRIMFGVHGPAEGSIEAPLDRAGRPAAPGPGPPHRAQQRHAAQIARGARDLRDRLRAEPVQSRAPRRRRADRRARAATASPMCRSSRSAASRPLQSSALSDVAGRLGATPMQVALAWLLRRAPNILLIPGTSSRRASAREPGRGDARAAGRRDGGAGRRRGTRLKRRLMTRAALSVLAGLVPATQAARPATPWQASA